MAQCVDEVQIRTLVDAWAKAVRVRDIEGALARHADDIVMFDGPCPCRLKAWKRTGRPGSCSLPTAPAAPGSFDVTELQITASETVAYAMPFSEFSTLART